MSDVILKIRDKSGIIRWKTDTFWSLTKNIKNTKLHSINNLDILLKNLIYILNYRTDYKKDKEFIEHWNGCKVGLDHIKDGGIIKSGIYLYLIKYNNKKFELVDISRKEKIKKIEELNEN